MSDSTSSTRVRGLASWNPHTVTRERLEDVEAVFEEYAEHRPLTIRQVLYRLAAQQEQRSEIVARARALANGDST